MSVCWSGENSKMKTAGEVRAMLKHLDTSKESRQKVKEAKERAGELCHINPELSPFNIEIDVRGGKAVESKGATRYEDTAPAFSERLKALDSLPGQNTRKGRVIAHNLEIPCPEWLEFDPGADTQTKIKQRAAISDYYTGAVNALIKEGVIDPKTVISMGVHLDEVHNYIDAETGENRTSRAHLHVVWLPLQATEPEGEKWKFNAREIITRSRIIKSNNVVEAYTREKYPGKKFNKGTKKKNKATVKQLKEESARRELERQAAEIERRDKSIKPLKEVEQALRAEIKDLKQARESVELIEALADSMRLDTDSYTTFRDYVASTADNTHKAYIMELLDAYEVDKTSQQAGAEKAVKMARDSMNELEELLNGNKQRGNNSPAGSGSSSLVTDKKKQTQNGQGTNAPGMDFTRPGIVTDKEPEKKNEGRREPPEMNYGRGFSDVFKNRGYSL